MAEGQAQDVTEYPPWRKLKILFVLALLLIPRIYTLFKPFVRTEEETDLYFAFLITRGSLPYIDFSFSQYPLLETVVSIWFSIFGTGVRSAEFLTQIVVLLTSLGLFLFVRGSGRKTYVALASSMVFACSSILFRHHVFSREYFVALCVVISALLAARGLTTTRVALISGLLLSLAMLTKLTAVAYVLSHLLYLLLLKRRKEAIITALAVLTVLSLSTLLCYAVYGSVFLRQVFVITNFVNTNSALSHNGMILYSAMPLLLLSSIAGIGFEAIRRRDQFPLLPVLHIIFGALWIIFWTQSPRSQDSIEILPWVALFAGTLFSGMVRALLRMRVDPRPALIDFLYAASLLSLSIIANWALPAEKYGARFIERSDLSEIAEYIRRTTRENDLIIAPQIIAFEANRILPASSDDVLPFIRQRKIKTVMTVTNRSIHATFKIPESLLSQSGYTVRFEKSFYRVWMSQ